MPESKFARTKGILFAADLDDVDGLYASLDEIAEDIAGVKIGNALLYESGAALIRNLKRDYNLPVIADLKLTDVSHIATRVARYFAENEADAIMVSGVCGRLVFDDIVSALPEECELWIFTEFTHSDGLIDERLANESIHLAVQAGAKGVQVPATRPYRIETVRAAIGENITIASCGIGVQGGTFGAAIKAGANFEIIGRSIFGKPSPKMEAKRINEAIKNAI